MRTMRRMWPPAWNNKCGVPVALNAEMDWRGPVGQLHRTIAPYMVMHGPAIGRADRGINSPSNSTRTWNGSIPSAHSSWRTSPRSRGRPFNCSTGVETNPWTFEIRAALGRHLFDYHQQLGIPPQQACEQAAEVLREAVANAKAERARLKDNHSNLDDYQNQLMQESYLFLAKSLTELGQYEEALAVCDEGFQTTSYNLLRVQKRITIKRMEEERTPSAEE